MFRQSHVDLSDPGPNTVLTYTYVDGMNYKHTHRAVFVGRIDADQVETLKAKLSTDAEFVPVDVGMTMLQPVVNAFFHPEADHAWHSLGAIETTRDAATTEQSIGELVARWSALTDWDPDSAEDKLREQLGPPPEEDDETDFDATLASPAP